jgi:hypothetical protein
VDANEMDKNETIVNQNTGQEFTVAELENSKRIVKSATPKGDLSWYIKWVSSVLVLIAVAFRASGVEELRFWDMILTWVSAIGWCAVGIMWKDRALTLVNGVVGIVIFAGILKWIFGA